MKKPALLIIMLFAFGLLSAQDDYKSFMESAGSNSALFKGAAPLLYRFVYTGTYYAYEKTYLEGDVLYNGKHYKGVRLNLNSHLDELIVWDEANKRSVQLKKDHVKQFTIGTRKFINVKEPDVSGMIHPGYYQLLYNNSVMVYKKIVKVYTESINQEYIASNRGLIKKFVSSVRYFLINQDGTYIIRRKKDILNLYPEKKKEIRKYIRSNDLYFNEDNIDVAIVSILSFIDNKHE
ncbi:MAG: hypothetical protein M0R37_06015 [Bacteroidales bacterium]|nr:hypothetical protein [Bacteroidales bacterium]